MIHRPAAQELSRRFPVDERFVQEAERKLGARLPESLRRLLMADNGGQVETPDDIWDLNPILDRSDRKRLRRTCNDILRKTGEARKWRGFPANAISIAQNGFGDHLVLLLTEGCFDPTVYFRSHETGKLAVLAPDFSHLLG